MSSANCLNCGNHIAEQYCGKCGQSAGIHRYSIKHFIEHDFIHGVWHVDKGILFTLKELLTNPGHSVRAFIQGKRAHYYNYITLILLILAISSIVSQYTHFKMADIMPEESRSTMNGFEKFTTKYPKLVLLISIPISSFFSFIWFRKAKFNYSEHLVLNSYKTSVELLVGLLFSILTIFYTNTAGLSVIYILAIQVPILIYGTWFYYQFFSESGYSKFSLILRSIMSLISFMLIAAVVGMVYGIFMGINK